MIHHFFLTIYSYSVNKLLSKWLQSHHHCSFRDAARRISVYFPLFPVFVLSQANWLLAEVTFNGQIGEWCPSHLIRLSARKQISAFPKIALSKRTHWFRCSTTLTAKSTASSLSPSLDWRAWRSRVILCEHGWLHAARLHLSAGIQWMT